MSSKEYIRKTPLTQTEHLNYVLFEIDNVKTQLTSDLKHAKKNHKAPKISYNTLSQLLNASKHLLQTMINQGMDPHYSELKMNNDFEFIRADTSENLNKLISQIDLVI